MNCQAWQPKASRATALLDDAAVAVERLQLSCYAIVTERLTAVAWRDIPSTYVICELDQAIPLPAKSRWPNARRTSAGC